MNIESNIPLPSPQRGRKQKYHYQKLEINQSFLIEGKNPRDIAGSINHARKKYPDREFATRKVPGGTRVWRTK